MPRLCHKIISWVPFLLLNGDSVSRFDISLQCLFHIPIPVTQYWRNKILEVAKEFPNVQVAVGDEESYAEKLKDLGLSESGEDVNVGLFDDKEQKYAMQEEFSQDALREFVQAFLDGKSFFKLLLKKI